MSSVNLQKSWHHFEKLTQPADKFGLKILIEMLDESPLSLVEMMLNSVRLLGQTKPRKMPVLEIQESQSKTVLSDENTKNLVKSPQVEGATRIHNSCLLGPATAEIRIMLFPVLQGRFWSFKIVTVTFIFLKIWKKLTKPLYSMNKFNVPVTQPIILHFTVFPQKVCTNLHSNVPLILTVEKRSLNFFQPHK